MKSSRKKNLIEEQYEHGETKGPWWYQQLAPYVKDREEVALSCIESINNKKILDLGCGEGNLVRTLARQAKEVVGTDIAENRLKIAKKKSREFANVSYLTADLDERLPFKNNSFDIVFMIGVLEYVLDPYHTLQEVKRVLKPNGIFIFEVPNLAFLPERFKLLVGILPSWPDATGWQGGRLHNFTYSSAIRLVETEGFEYVKKAGSGFLQPIRNIWPELLCGDIIIMARKK